MEAVKVLHPETSVKDKRNLVKDDLVSCKWACSVCYGNLCAGLEVNSGRGDLSRYHVTVPSSVAESYHHTTPVTRKQVHSFAHVPQATLESYEEKTKEGWGWQ